jgi:alpha/beta superfamily hydrolase
MENAMRDPAIAGYMGSADKQLFYCYHPPLKTTARSFGFVLCPPAGRDYVFAHRNFRQLATLLTRAGFPVLRFDYFASGDSAGKDDEGSVEQWLDDIATAVNTFHRHTAATEVCLAGFRLGASLAALYAVGRQDVNGLILWDAIVNGERYVDTLLAAHERWLRLQTWRDRIVEPTDAAREVIGFLLSPLLEKGLRAIDLTTLPRAPAPRALLISSSAQPDPENFGSLLDRLGMNADRQHVAWPEFWNENQTLADVLMPSARVLQAMVAWAQDKQP